MASVERYKLDIVDVQQNRREKGGTVRAGVTFFSMEKETKIINWEQNFFVHHRILSAVKRVEFISDRMSYIGLRGRWCNIVVFNVHAPREKESDETKDAFYETLEEVFDHLSKYNLKIMLGDFNAKLEKEDIFKPAIGNESLNQDSNDNYGRIVKFAT
jgi:exonuclease III